MPTALFLSPHLDDVAFSCGGTLLRLTGDPDWRVVLCTIFTASVPDPQGFALRCQTDKGIAPEVDYMALRRAEDEDYAAFAGVDDARRWNHREAPHRGYQSPTELFAGPRDTDTVCQPLTDDFGALDDELRPDLVFAPQGLGNHVDHLQTIRATLAVWPVERVAWYRDTPYAIREPDAQPAGLLERFSVAEAVAVPARQSGTARRTVPTLGTTGAVRLPGRKAQPSLEGEPTPYRVSLPPGVLERKISGACRYASQLGFQFGGAAALREMLTAFHALEASADSPVAAAYAETFLGHPCVLSILPK